jgi:protein SCO1/2
MAGLVMNAARFFAVFLALAGCSQASPPQSPLAGATIGGPFALIDQDGRSVTDRDFAGRYRIMYFGYTSCPDVCPTDLQTLGAAMRLLDKADPAASGRITPVFVTVDPARDTPAALKPFVSAFYPRLVGLTGSPQAIAGVAREYRVFYQAQPANAEGGYTVQHSDQAILFGPDGKPIVIVPVQDGPQAVEATLERWVR